MNRRDLLRSVAGMAATAGITVKAVEAVEAHPVPALAVFESEHPISNDAVARMSTQWSDTIKDTPFAGTKAVFLHGFTLTLIDSHGRALNRRLDDA